MPVAISTARLEARISTDLHSMLKRAAELQGRTMTDFVVSAVRDAAQRAIEQAEVIRLSLADQECFAQALLSPSKPAPPMLPFASGQMNVCSPRTLTNNLRKLAGHRCQHFRQHPVTMPVINNA